MDEIGRDWEELVRIKRVANKMTCDLERETNTASYGSVQQAILPSSYRGELKC